MLIKEPVHAHRLGGFNDVPEMLLIVQLIEITPDGAALCAGQLHRIGQYLVTGLFSIELPCVVLPGAFQENVTLPKTVCPRGPGHPKQGLIHGLIAGGVPMDNAFANVKVILIKGGMLSHDLFQRGQNIHIFKLLHSIVQTTAMNRSC